MARPPKDLDLDMLERLAAVSLSQDEIGAIMGMTSRTIRRKLSSSKMARDAYDRGYERCKASLKRKQFEMAMDGQPTLLVWLGKQHLGQRDESRVQAQVDANVTTKTVDVPPPSESYEDWLKQRVGHIYGDMAAAGANGSNGQ